MRKRNFINDAKEVINLDIKALQKLKKNINNSFMWRWQKWTHSI